MLSVISGCGCNPLTTTANICEDYRGSYRCLCKSNFQGFFCGQCRRGYYDFPICKSEYISNTSDPFSASTSKARKKQSKAYGRGTLTLSPNVPYFQFSNAHTQVSSTNDALLLPVITLRFILPCEVIE